MLTSPGLTTSPGTQPGGFWPVYDGDDTGASMSQSQGIVGAQQLGDGSTPVTFRAGNFGEFVVSDMNGFFYEQTERGNAYVWSTALAGNALVAATTSNAPALWNPPQNPNNLVLQKITYNRTAVGTPLEGGIVYLFFRATSGPGTAAPVVSYTAVAGQNCKLGSPDSSGMIFAPTTISMTTGPAYFANAGISQAASTGTTTGVQSFQLVDWLYGSIIIPPGWLFAIGAQVSLSTTYAISIYGMALPQVQQA